MKKLRYVFYLVLCPVFIGCDNHDNVDTINYTQRTINEFNEMKPPVLLITKTRSIVGYGVQLMDGNGVLPHFGDMSNFANGIGEGYNLGDTIK